MSASGESDYLPLYAEPRCMVCGYWRGQHASDGEMQCPVDSSWFGVTATFVPKPT